MVVSVVSQSVTSVVVSSVVHSVVRSVVSSPFQLVVHSIARSIIHSTAGTGHRTSGRRPIRKERALPRLPAVNLLANQLHLTSAHLTEEFWV